MKNIVVITVFVVATASVCVTVCSRSALVILPCVAVGSQPCCTQLAKQRCTGARVSASRENQDTGNRTAGWGVPDDRSLDVREQIRGRMRSRYANVGVPLASASAL